VDRVHLLGCGRLRCVRRHWYQDFESHFLRSSRIKLLIKSNFSCFL